VLPMKKKKKVHSLMVAHACNLANQETVIKRIMVRNQPQANSLCETLSQKKPFTKKGLVA
jgi:hypothetical protein